MSNKIALFSLMAAVLFLAPTGSALGEITIGDHSFENQSMSAGIYNYIESPWFSSVTGPWASYEGQYGVFNVPDGTQYGTPSNDDLYQDLADTYVDGVTYTLTALASARGDDVGTGSYDDWQIALHDTSGTVLASNAAQFDLVQGQWQEISVSYTATAADDGNPIRVYFDANGGGYQFVLDDVHLTSVTNTGAVISKSSALVSEAGISDSYTIVLSTVPTANVTITAAGDDGEIDIGNGAGAAINLFFTTSDWSTAQTVTVTAIDDTVYEDGPGGTPHITTINHSAQQTGGDSEYDGISISTVEVSVIDNELGCGDWGYLPTDFNQDCYVDLADFAYFALYYLDGYSQLSYDLTGYWKFDDGGGTAAADSSGNGNDGTLINFPVNDSQWVLGQINGALEFDGDNDYVEVPDTASLSNMANITISAWINPDTITAKAGGYRIISKWNPTDKEFILKHSQTGVGGSGEIFVGFYGNSAYTSNFNLPANSWTHLCVVWGGSTTIEVYKNGVLFETLSLSSPSPYDSTAPTVIGKHGSISAEYFDGRIDEVRIYDRVLSFGEIYDLAN